jgi:hypothetical protein
LIIVPILPHFQLDAVMTRDELIDKRKRESMLALLRNANGNLGLAWAGAGLITICAGSCGLWASGRTASKAKDRSRDIDQRSRADKKRDRSDPLV